VTSSRILLLSALGAGCLTASGVGGYLAMRSTGPAAAASEAGNIRPEPAVTAAAPVAAPSTEAARTFADTERLTPEPARASSAGTRKSPLSARVETSAPAVAEPPARRTEVAPADAVARESASPVLPEPTAAAGPVVPVAEFSTSTAAKPEPPAVREVTVPRDAVIGIRLETAVSSETAVVEDRVRAEVTRDVRVDDEVVIPAGAQLEGTVTLVERGGRFKDRARIGVQFTTLVIDNARLPIRTEAIYRDGEAPTKEATSKIGASAVVGTILGAVIGGKKGAAIGGTAGAAGGTAAVMAGGRNDASIAKGAALTVRLTESVVLGVAREPNAR